MSRHPEVRAQRASTGDGQSSFEGGLRPPPQDDGTIGLAMRRRLAGFARTLRDNGFKVGLAETRDALAVLASPAAVRAIVAAVRAARAVLRHAFRLGEIRRDLRRRSGAGATCAARATLSGVSTAEAQGAAPSAKRRRRKVLRVSRIASQRGDGRRVRRTGRREGASHGENLAATDLRHITDPADIARAHELAARLARSMRARLVRREQVRRRGRRLDLRRTIHRNVSHGGTPIDLAWRRRKIKPLRLVILLDASGSMELYTAFFVRFLHGVVDAFREAEAFVFHTRLAHVSPSLRDRDVTRAVDKLALMAQGIGGGTRIGESLATFNRWHARRVINSRTAVMIVSDGYDTGEPERLGAEMRRLRQRCRRIVWLNPLIGWRDYSPQARGMQAALPYVDLFAPAHNLESLAALEPYLARI